MTLKNKRKNRTQTKMQKKKTNFQWLSERECKERHLSMELSGKFRFDVIWNAVMWLCNQTVYCPY